MKMDDRTGNGNYSKRIDIAYNLQKNRKLLRVMIVLGLKGDGL